MAESHDANLLQWALAGISAGLTGAFTWLWNRLAGLETRQDAAMRDLWAVVNSERDKAQASREKLLERLADMPTKDDFQRLEDRLTAALHQPRQ
jgi:hypothetical protein